MGIFRKIRNFFRSLVIYVVTLFLLLTTMPIGFVMLLPFITYRQIVICAARILKPEMGKVLSSRSIPAASEDLYENPRMTIVLGIVCERSSSKENLGLKAIQEIVQREAVLAKDTNNGSFKYPELSQNVKSWMGYSFWNPVKNFNIEHHINYFEESESSELTASELSHHLRTLSLRPFRKDRALWEMRIVPNFYLDGEDDACTESQKNRPTEEHSSDELKERNAKHFLIMFRCHHCLCDGLSLLQLFDKFSLREKLVLHPKSNLKGVHHGNSLPHQLLDFIKLPADLGALIFNSGLTPGKILWKEPMLQRKVSHKILQKLLPTIREEDGTFSGAFSSEFPFSRIQVLCQQYRVSGTSIILAGVSSVIRSFMSQGGGGSMKLDSNVPLHVIFPLPGRSDKLRNHAMVTSILLPIGEVESVKRLLKIDKALSAAKSSTIPTFFVYFTSLLAALPANILRRVRSIVDLQHRIFFTNTAGPVEPMDMFGALVKRFHFTCGMVKDSNTLGMAFGTFDGNATFSVAADQRLLSSCEAANSCVELFLKELEVLERNQGFVV